MKFNRKRMPPMATPSAGLVPYLSPKAKQQEIDAVYYEMGGRKNYRAWAEANPGEYYTKHWLRNVPRPVLEDQPSGSSMEDLLDKVETLERAANAKTINGECTVVEDAAD